MDLIELAQQSPDKILDLAKSNFSGLNGMAASNVGYRKPGLDFFGDPEGSLVNSKTQPVGIRITNSHATLARSFYLSYGEDDTVQGALKVFGSAFDAIEDTVGDESLIAISTIASVNAAKFLKYCRRNPAFVPQIKVNAGNPSLFKSTYLEIGEPYNPLVPKQPKSVKISSYQRDGLLRSDDEFIIKDKVIISDENMVKLTVPANSSIDLELTAAVALNKVLAFLGDINAAVVAAVGSPEMVQAVQVAQEAKRLESTLRG
jgi:hypothetical protein